MQGENSAPQWEPSEDGLRSLLELLQHTITGDTEMQKNVLSQLNHFSETVPDYNNYLCFILCQIPDLDCRLRQQAGIQMKNSLQRSFSSVHPDSLDYIFALLCQSVADPERAVRRTIALCLTNIVRLATLGRFPMLLPFLGSALESNNAFAIDGALVALDRIFEDHAAVLASEEHAEVLSALLPLMIQRFGSQESSERIQSLQSINRLVFRMPVALAANIDPYLEGLFMCSSDSEPEVVKNVILGFSFLLEHADILQPYLASVVQYMLQMTMHEDETICLPACEFWVSLSESSVCAVALEKDLENLCQVLLQRMVHPDEVVSIIDESEDTSIPDRPEHINPSAYHHHTRVMGGHDDDEDGDDFDAGDYADPSEWTIRKCAAYALDQLSNQDVFGGDILEPLLPCIAQMFNPENAWPIREAAILALGAVVEGCFPLFEEHLENVIPYLVASIGDPVSVVRQMACWTLSRFSGWVVGANQPVDVYFEPTLAAFLEASVDKKKNVQRAACSALASLIEESKLEIRPYLDKIVPVLIQCFSMYQERNLVALYDAVGVLVEAVRDAVTEDGFFDALLEPLIAKWSQVGDLEREIIPLLECLNCLVSCLGQPMIPYVTDIFGRCIRIASSVMEHNMLVDATEDGEKFDRNFVVSSMDLISGIAEGLRSSFESLIPGSSILDLVMQVAQDADPYIRQSGFALIGQIVRFALPHIQEQLTDISRYLLDNIQPYVMYLSACNNAIWTLGEIVRQVGEDAQPIFASLMEKLATIMKSERMGRGILETSATAISRIGMFAPSVVAPYLSSIAQTWCIVLREMEESEEKHDGFVGLCVVTRQNFMAMSDVFNYLAAAFASWKPNRVSSDLKEEMRSILQEYKKALGGDEGWRQYVSSANFPESLSNILHNEFGM